jgi:predicted NUDIX family NTP pyrophosphohydrolase
VTRHSAGILVFRVAAGAPEVLLVHPGGPFWEKRDLGAWSVPKGEVEAGEGPCRCALRELGEELGPGAPTFADGELLELGSARLKSGKVVECWAAEGDFDPARLQSNTFAAEWPPRSGREQEFPEVDRAEWFDPEMARSKLNAAQAVFVDRLLDRLGSGAGG